MSIKNNRKMKKIYSRPMMEIERLMGEQILAGQTSLNVYNKNDDLKDEFVDEFEDLLSDQSSLWDEDEVDGKMY